VNGDAPPLILHVIHHLVIGGMENGLVNLVNNLPEGKYRHAIVCIEDYSAFRRRIARPDVEIIALHRSRIGAWRMRFEIFQLCRRLRPVIVHSRNQSGLDALFPAWLARVPTRIHGEHGWDVDNLHGNKWKPALLRRLHAPLVDRYIVVSKHLERFLVDRIGLEPARVVQIYNGVDTERFKPARQAPTDRLPEHFRGDEVLRIGSVGRLQPVKDQATLLRAFAALVQRHHEMRARLRLVIAGDGPLLADLRRLAESMGISEVTWFSGELDNIHQILPALDVFVLPSLNEGISNTILEAMACGIPIVATAVGGTTELVQDQVGGRLFAPGDVSALSEALAEYVAEPAHRKAQGIAARQIAVDRFSLSQMVARYEAVYDYYIGAGRYTGRVARQRDGAYGN